MSKYKIIMVDDDHTVLGIGEMMLEQEGYQIYTFERGQDALALLEKDPNFNLVILDLMMPAMSGLDVLEAIKANKNTKDIPILIQTGMNAPAEIKTAYKLGALSCISKPYSKDKFLAKVLECVKKSCKAPNKH